MGFDSKIHKTTHGTTLASDSTTTACFASGFVFPFFFFFSSLCGSLKEKPSDARRLIRGGLALLAITRQCVLASPLRSSKRSVCSGPSRISALSRRHRIVGFEL